MRIALAAATAIVATLSLGATAIGASSQTARPGASAPLGPQLPIEGQVTNPDWVQLPTAADVERFYPQLGGMLGIEGVVRLDCTVSALGMLENCQVIGEAPLGVGFGEAALLMAPLFHMKPMSVDGTPVSGAHVTVPLRFNMGSSTDASDESVPALPPPSDQALLLGRRLVEAQGGRAQQAIELNKALEQFEKVGVTSGQSQATTDAHKALLDAMREAYASNASSYFEALADYYARAFSVAELNQIIAFEESPAGRTWTNHQPDIAAAGRAAGQAYNDRVKADVKRLFCQHVICPTAETVRPAPLSR